MAKTGEPPKILSDCYRWYQDDKAKHDPFRQKVDARLDVYHGILDAASDAASWTNKLAPRYAFQVIEMMVAGLADPDPGWRLKARPRMADQQELHYYREGVRYNSILLDEQASIDHFAEKQRPFALQGLIAGLTVGKSYWRFREEEVTRYQPVAYDPILDDLGQVAVPGGTSWEDVPKLEVIHDDPTFEVCDVRNIIWHSAATSIDRCLRLHHRLFLTWEELKSNECEAGSTPGHEGPCKNGIYHNLDELKEKKGDVGDIRNRDSMPGQAGDDMSKDLFEIVDSWVEHGKRNVIHGGHGKVLLADRDNPYRHGCFPFIFGSSNPGHFTIPGTSEVELMADEQTFIWTLRNQTADYLQLVNNPIFWFAPEIEDYKDYEWHPGARWPGRPDQITQMQMQMPNFDAVIKMIAMAKDDLQNIPGASPALLGQTDPSTQTATEVSLLANFAQRRVMAKKQNLMTLPLKRLGEQWIDLNQQFIRQNRVVELVGPGGLPYAVEIDPKKLQGRYYIDLEEIDASLSKRERQAEAQSKLQVVQGALQAIVAIRQADPTVRLPDFEALVNDVYESVGISDTDRYWKAPKPQQPVAPPGGPQGPPGMNGQPNPDPMAQNGTSPLATDQQAPSNAQSMSPVAADQRLGATTGGPTNVGY